MLRTRSRHRHGFETAGRRKDPDSTHSGALVRSPMRRNSRTTAPRARAWLGRGQAAPVRTDRTRHRAAARALRIAHREARAIGEFLRIGAGKRARLRRHCWLRCAAVGCADSLQRHHRPLHGRNKAALPQFKQYREADGSSTSSFSCRRTFLLQSDVSLRQRMPAIHRRIKASTMFSPQSGVALASASPPRRCRTRWPRSRRRK